MSFLLKSPRMATALIGFTRQAKFAFRERKIFPSSWQHSCKVNQKFVRSCSLAPQNIPLQNAQKNMKETLYQKSIAQVYFDVKLKGYILKEDFNNAWCTLKSSTAYTLEQTTLLIRSCGHNLPLETAPEKLKLVKEVWDSFDDIGIKKTIHHYNALLDVYIELEHNFSPKDFLSNLENQGVTPDLQTYKKLLHALGIQGNISNAQHFLEHMKMNFVSINNGVFNSLILGYSLQGDFISARGILELMKEKNLTLSSESYLSLALGYAKRGDIDKVKEIVDECSKETTFSNQEFLEIAYTFAANNHSEHFSTIVDMIPLKKNFPLLSNKVVHRLLHLKKDKEAFMLLELRDKLGSGNMLREPLQMFLDHYVRFRKPAEVFNITENYARKGWTSIALAYCIKETLIQKDIPHCLNFLNALKTMGHPLRVHYFYPILIKSHQFGNEEVIKILRHMRKNQMLLGREAAKAFHSFYDFLPGAELEDLEKLKDAGVKQKLVAWKILDILFCRENIDKAVELVSISGIAYPAVLLPFSMAFAFSKHPSEHKKFVYILDHLIHNIRAARIRRRMNTEIDPVEYEVFLVEMARTCDKTFILGVMEEMLRKKIPLSPSAASFISKSLSYPEATELIKKLTSADLKMEFDDTLLMRLIKAEESGGESFFKKKEINREWSELYKAVKREGSIPDVMKIFESLAQQTEFLKNKSHQNAVEMLFTYVSRKGDVANTERVYRIGVKKNLIRAAHYDPCVTAHLVSGNLDDAVKRYYEGLKATKKSSLLETLIKRIKSKNLLLLLNDLNASISKVYNQKFAATHLLVKFAKLGHIEEARRILESKTEILQPLFNELCKTMFNKNNVKYFEVLEKVSRNSTKLNLNFILHQLLKLYAFQGNLMMILKLYVTLECDDCMEEEFRNFFFKYLKGWPGDVPEKLKNVFWCVLKDCETKKSLKGTDTLSHEENIQSAWSEDIQLNFPSESMSISNLSNEKILECFCLIQAGNLDKYFNILRNEIAENGPNKAMDYFFCYKLVPYMKKNPTYLKRYEKLVSMCNTPAVWKKYIKLCLRLGNATGIKTAMQKLTPEQFEFCLKDVSFEDCMEVIESEHYHQDLGKGIAIFFSEIVNRCKNENKSVEKAYEMAKKLGLEYLLQSSHVIH